MSIQVLSVRQPWADAAVQGWKPVETRSRNTSVRGRHLIHASARVYKASDLNPVMSSFYPGNPKELAYGAIIGSVELTKTYTTTAYKQLLKERVEKGIITKREHDIIINFGDFGPGRYAYEWQNPVAFEPVPCKGQLQFFSTANKRNFEIKSEYNSFKWEHTHILYYFGQELYRHNHHELCEMTRDELISPNGHSLLYNKLKEIEKQLFKLI